MMRSWCSLTQCGSLGQIEPAWYIHRRKGEAESMSQTISAAGPDVRGDTTIRRSFTRRHPHQTIRGADVDQRGAALAHGVAEPRCNHRQQDGEDRDPAGQTAMAENPKHVVSEVISVGELEGLPRARGANQAQTIHTHPPAGIRDFA